MTAENWKRIEYDFEFMTGDIVLPEGAPFDGEHVLILLGAGIVEARWMGWEPSPTLEDPNDGNGYCWVCLDDSAPQAELDDPTHWMTLPPPPATEDGDETR